jgi:hypothetical protein
MAVFLLAVNFLGVAFLCWYRLRTRGFQIVDPAWGFIGGYFITYCLRPMLIFSDPAAGGVYDLAYLNPASHEGFSAPLMFGIVGLASFAVGDLCFSRLAREVSVRLPTSDLRAVVQSRWYTAIASCFLMAGCASLYGFVFQTGWAGTLFDLLQGHDRYEFTPEMAGHGYYMMGMHLALIGWALMLVKWIGFPRKTGAFQTAGRRILQIFWFSVTLAIWLGVGERVGTVMTILMPFFVWVVFHVSWQPAKKRKANGRKAIFVAALILLLFFAIAGPIGLLMKGLDMEPAAMMSMAMSPWDSFELTAIAQHQMRASELMWGSTYFGDLFYSWLPRSFFPSKPERYGFRQIQDALLPEEANNDAATFPPGILVEAFANFWYPGLLVIPLVIGVFCQSIYLRLGSKDLFWLVQSMLFLSTFATFRGFGSAFALLIVDLIILTAVVSALRLKEVLFGPVCPSAVPLAGAKSSI